MLMTTSGSKQFQVHFATKTNDKKKALLRGLFFIDLSLDRTQYLQSLALEGDRLQLLH
jgi:hypothetical protein